MSKKNSRKRILIAVSLIALILIGIIVSIVVVFAAENQNVETNFNIAYRLNGVGASIESSYAVVPVDEAQTITRTAMEASNGSTTLKIGVSDEEITATMNPSEKLGLSSKYQQIVFEYVFTNISESAFSLSLESTPLDASNTTNMTQSYLVSSTRLSTEDYRDKIVDEEFQIQNMSMYGQKVYVYVSAKVLDPRRIAKYSGEFVWDLSNQTTVSITLNERGETRNIKMIPSTEIANIAMPVVKPEMSLTEMFFGYNTAADGSGKTYISRDGTTPDGIIADLAAGTTLYAQIVDAFVVEGTTITGLTEAGQAEEVLYIPSGITAIGDGTNAITTNATTIYVPNTVTAIAANAFSGNTTIEYVNYEAPVQTAAYADGSGLTSIGEKAFYNCTALKEINIPESVTSIATYSFYGTTAVETINFDAIACADLSASNYVFYNSGKTSANITATIGSKVTKLPNYLFCPYNSNSYTPKITTLTFKDYSSCETIGNYSFYLVSSLTNLTLSSQIKTIGSNAFYNCTGLKSITIPESVTSIASAAFQGCSGLKRVDTPSLESWLGISFANAYSNPIVLTKNLYIAGELATEIEIPNGITQLKNYAFYNHLSLTKITLPDSLTTIGTQALRGTKIESIDIPEGITSVGSYLFRDCNNLKEVTIPKSVTSIGAYSFYNCTALTKINYNATACANLPNNNYVFYKAGQSGGGIAVNIGANVTKIPAYIFYPCDNLSCSPNIKTVNFENASVCASIGNYSFAYCSSLRAINIPSNVTSIGDKAFYCCDGLIGITIPSTVTNIGSYAFYSCYNLVQVKNLSGLTLNGYSKPTYAEVLTEDVEFSSVVTWEDKYVTMTNGVEKILLFSIEKTITSADDMPSDITIIGNYAFSDCTALKSVTFPQFVKAFSLTSFENCTALESLSVDSANGSYSSVDGSNCILNASKKTLILGCKTSVIPSSVTTIYSYAFRGCIGLKTITIPSSVTTIYNSAFSGCTGLTSAITIPSSVKYLGTNIFQGCLNLKSVIFEEGSLITTIPNYTFSECESLISINIPTGVSGIGPNAFSYCFRLVEITIPSTVTNIANTAFALCDGLVRVKNLSGIDLNTTGCVLPEYAEVLTIDTTFSSQIKNIGSYRYYSFGQAVVLLHPTIQISGYVTNIRTETTHIGVYAFYNATQLTSVTLPSKVVSIGDYAFVGCSELKHISIPASVTKIGKGAFSNCTKLVQAEFETKSGWMVAQTTTGTWKSVAVSNKSTAATYLNTEYVFYYWKRS